MISRLTEKLKEEHKEFPHAPHPHSPNVGINFCSSHDTNYSEKLGYQVEKVFPVQKKKKKFRKQNVKELQNKKRKNPKNGQKTETGLSLCLSPSIPSYPPILPLLSLAHTHTSG